MPERPENRSVEVEPQAVDNTKTRYGTGLAPQCPNPNVTTFLVRRRYVRYQDRMTYHYHHAP